MDKQVSDNEDHFEGTSAENPTNINPGVDGFYESADHAIHEDSPIIQQETALLRSARAWKGRSAGADIEQ